MAETFGDVNALRYRGYVYDTESGLYYLQSRYYDPTLSRFINADVFTSNGQGLLGNNMFAYCLNNPVLHVDPNGESALMTFLFAVTGATINVITTFIGAAVTGQSYSFADGCAAALSGAACAFGSVGALVAGLISGAYSGYMSYQNGAEWWGALLVAFASGILTTAGIGNLASLEQTLANLGIQAFTDLIFCTGYNSMSAAIYNAVTPDTPTNEGASVNPSPSISQPTSRNTPRVGGGSGGGNGRITVCAWDVAHYC